MAAIAPTRAKEPKQKAVDELMLMRYGLFDLREAELQLLVVGERLLRSMRDSGWIVAGRLYDDSGRSGETWETKTAEAQRWLDYLQGGGYVERQEPPATPSQGQTFQSAQSWRLKTDVNRQLLAEAIEKWRGVRRKA